MKNFEFDLDRRKRQSNFRTLTTHKCPIDFASNDYLGLARTGFPLGDVRGSTGSRLLTGNCQEVEELEQKIASFHWAEAGLIMNSGYCANLGLLSTIGGPEVYILYDSDIHASVIDGIKLGSSRGVPFRHQNLNHLEELLKIHPRAYVCTESVFSCDGSIAPLKEIMQLCARYEARLILDEAHATGILGPEGRGLACEIGVSEQIFARVHTFSKALGTHGAIILGSAQLRDYLINFCRPFIYATALPSIIIKAVERAYTRFPQMEHERLHLRLLSEHFIQRLSIPSSNTPVKAILIPGNLQVKQRALQIKQAGYDVRALLSPTVRRRTERLRVCLHAFNTLQEIDHFKEALCA